jgi:hypothetical protein
MLLEWMKAFRGTVRLLQLQVHTQQYKHPMQEQVVQIQWKV